MKSERLKGLPSTTTTNCNYYTSFTVQTLPRQKDCSDFTSTSVDEGDIEEYYPFVMRRGKSFKFIDPKMYKQLRKNNIHQTKRIRIADCAKKTAKQTKDSKLTSTNITTAVESEEDEYCELSPLAKVKAPTLPPRKPKILIPESKDSILKPTTPQGLRVQNDYYDPKAWMVKLNSQNKDSVTTKLCDDKVDLKSRWTEIDKIKEQNQIDEESSTRYICGHDSEEIVDYATCMCCVKGLFYHCTKDSDCEGSIADDPCSCSGPLKSCLPRWGCLAIFSLFLPCLWCYPPIAGCRKAATCLSCKKQKKKEKQKSKCKSKNVRTSTS